MGITQETRREGHNYALENLSPRMVLIISALRDGPMTAPEVADRLGFSDLNAVKPRLHELMNMGVVKTVGKRESTRSHLPNTVMSWWKGAEVSMAMIEDPEITAAVRTGWPLGAAAENRDCREYREEFAQEHFAEFLAFAEDGDPDLLEHFVQHLGYCYRDFLN